MCQPLDNLIQVIKISSHLAKRGFGQTSRQGHRLPFPQSRNWLALLSADIEFSDEKILGIYSKRWDIEIFFQDVPVIFNANPRYQDTVQACPDNNPARIECRRGAKFQLFHGSLQTLPLPLSKAFAKVLPCFLQSSWSVHSW